MPVGTDAARDRVTARDVLKAKGHGVKTIGPAAGVREAVAALADNGVGSLLVVEGDRIVGIVSERDILRALAKDFEGAGSLRVMDVMTDRVVIGLEDDGLDGIMALMTERRIRHLPIVAQGKLSGLLSIGDVVKAKARHSEAVVRYLTDYIIGQYPG